MIGAKVGGYIAEVAVTDNQTVHAGDVLVRIDDRDYRAALAKAEGAVAAQQALLANLDATARLQEAVIAQARAGIAATNADTLRAHDDQVRYASLVAKAAVSIQSSQKADSDYKQAQANGEKARAALLAAQRQLDVIGTQKQQAQASLAQASAERDIAKLNLGYTELRAPVDGTVGNRRARVAPLPVPAASCCPSCRPAGCGWTPTSRKGNWRTCAPACRSRLKPMLCRGGSSMATSPAWRPPPVRSSACCRRRMPPATSPRSSSACRCGSAWMSRTPGLASCVQACR